VCAHAPSDPLLDRIETYAVKKVLEDYAYKIPVSSIKSMIGNPLAAGGPMQIIASVMAIRDKIIPPTINYEDPDPECDLDYVPNNSRNNNIKTVLVNSHGIGGSNASIIITEYRN
jgi:3-oxoacyl-[acyl-carrier-protein] synthase II